MAYANSWCSLQKEASARRGDRHKIEMHALIDEEDLSEARADADARCALSYLLTEN